jgi:hypothetical protein
MAPQRRRQLIRAEFCVSDGAGERAAQWHTPSRVHGDVFTVDGSM